MAKERAAKKIYHNIIQKSTMVSKTATLFKNLFITKKPLSGEIILFGVPVMLEIIPLEMKYGPQILLYLHHKILLQLKIYFTKAEIRKQLHHQHMVLKMEILLICSVHLLENKQLHKLQLNPLMEIH